MNETSVVIPIVSPRIDMSSFSIVAVDSLSSSHHFEPKFSIKLRQNNYLLWNQQAGSVIIAQRIYKIVVNP